MKNISDIINEAIEKDGEYVVVLSGGSVGTSNNYAVSGQHATLYMIDDNKFVGSYDECKEYASRSNKGLSAGEKKYYRMRYKVIALNSLKYSDMKKLSEDDKDKIRNGIDPSKNK